jgi:hypothetical protein
MNQGWSVIINSQSFKVLYAISIFDEIALADDGTRRVVRVILCEASLEA